MTRRGERVGDTEPGPAAHETISPVIGPASETQAPVVQSEPDGT